MDKTLTTKNDRVLSKLNWVLHDRLFSEESMYEFVHKTAIKENLSSVIKVLPLMKEYHKGQTRKGPDNVPFINHPLLMACHAITLGLCDDNLIAAILLHDVCEDCDVSPKDLPVNETIQELVDYLTYTELPGETEEDSHLRYYSRISENTFATIIKIIDRCNNVTSMAAAFTPEHMISYINETEEYVLPLLENLKNKEDGKYFNTAFLLKYHMLSVLESDKHILALM